MELRAFCDDDFSTQDLGPHCELLTGCPLEEVICSGKVPVDCHLLEHLPLGEL